MATTVKVTDNTGKVLELTEELVLQALEEIGITAEGYAKMLCAVDTGRLRNSITHAVSKNRGADAYTDNQGNSYSGGSARGDPERYTVYVGTNVEYAAYVEMGTTQTKAQPFLKPAITDHIDEYIRLIKAKADV